MSILSKSNSNNMGTPYFHEFKKQASFFLKEKIKTARLALTDVTPAELSTEEATNGNPWAPDTKTLGSISRAAFELEDYWRIVEILHKRLLRFDRKNWRASYNSLIVLEHLLTHGPESVAEEFQNDKDVIREMGSFQLIDEKGFNWGLTVRKKSEIILKLLEKGTVLKEERDRARKLTRGIQGFGSFSQRSSSAQGILQESLLVTYGRCNSHFNNHENQDEQFLSSCNAGLIAKVERSQQSQDDINSKLCDETENSSSWSGFSDGHILMKPETSFKENMAPKKEELHELNCKGESRPLLVGKKDEPRMGITIEEDHPFSDTQNHTTASLLSARD